MFAINGTLTVSIQWYKSQLVNENFLQSKTQKVQISYDKFQNTGYVINCKSQPSLWVISKVIQLYIK